MSESYKAHWRAAENDAIPYPKDFAEWPTMTIELLNGGKKPTEISQRLDFKGDKVLYKYRDNGYGCDVPEARVRLLQWAATEAVDGKSVYGHGTKKFLAKSGNYSTLNFRIRSRVKGKSQIVEWRAPFIGPDTDMDIVEIPDFPKHGFEIEVEIDKAKLGDGVSCTPLGAFNVLKEIVCARKQQKVLRSIKFTLEVLKDGELVKKEDSITDNWKSFEETLATHPDCKLLFQKSVPFTEGMVNLEYTSYMTGDLKEIPGFPVYGHMTGGVGTRVHISNEDTMIEAYSWWDMMSRKEHPSGWHRVDFARFVPVDPSNMEHIKALPDPATTKVAYRYETDKWKKFVRIVNELYETYKEDFKLVAKEEIKKAKTQTPSAQSSFTASLLADSGVRAEPAPSAGKVAAPSAPAASTLPSRPHAASTAPPAPPAIPVNPIVPAPPTPPAVPARAPVTMQKASLFESVTMNELYTRYVAEGKEPSRYVLPAWLGVKEHLLIYKEDNKTKVIFYRQRVKGELSEDVEKAYVALSRYANEKNIKPEKISMIFCLHCKSVKKERIREFEECKKTMHATVYPYVNCIQLELLKDLE